MRARERAWAGGTGHPECRAGLAHDFAGALLHDGDHGGGHHLHDAAAAELDPP